MRLLLLMALLLSAGCAHTDRVEPAEPLPTGPEAIAAHNTRVARLERLWARAIVTIRFTDDKGNKKWEQGDGHFQLKDASKLALSIGKVGEVLIWIGADDERYWVLDKLTDEPVVYTGAHEALTPERLQRTGLPVPPRELLRLGGLQPIDDTNAMVSRDDEGRTLVTTRDASGAWRYTLNSPPEDDLPLLIERLNADGEVVLSASLEQPKRVRVADGKGFPPRTFSRLLVTSVATGDSISILLDGEIIDGRRRNLPRNAVFDLDVLTDAYGPFARTVDLDED